MTASNFTFETSRCKEIIDAAIERRKGSSGPAKLPLEARIILLLNIRVETAVFIDARFSPSEREEILTSQSRMLFLLIPELFTDEGIALYRTLAQTFLRDMKDLKAKNGI